MGKISLLHAIRSEVLRLNKIIDRKIVSGLPYSREARKHKELVAKVDRLVRRDWFARSLRFMTLL